MIRVAFTMIDGVKWKGGYNYLLNLLRILNLHQKSRITPVLFTGKKCAPGEIEPFQAIDGVEIVQTPLLDKNRRIHSLVQSLLLGRDISLQRLFGVYRIDSVFEAAQFFGWRLGLPAIAWITDFQHLELPEMFSFRARWKRDMGFRAQVLGRRIIMLSSEHARRICEANYPKTVGYTKTIHFAVPSMEGLSINEALNIADSYGLPEHFFYLPNQFWKHKNHVRVVKALAILRQRGTPMVVACSGKQNDYRDPEYFKRIKSLVKELGVESDFYFLGLIPYSHVTALMYASVALINPSLSEGWSTPVEEARALGVPTVLSDIPVHREQMGTRAIYFNRYSSQSLATAIESFKISDTKQRNRLSYEAEYKAEKRIKRFSEKFTQLIEHSVQEWDKL